MYSAGKASCSQTTVYLKHASSEYDIILIKASNIQKVQLIEMKDVPIPMGTTDSVTGLGSKSRVCILLAFNLSLGK